MIKALTEKLTQAVGRDFDKSGPGPDLLGLGERVGFNEGYNLMAIDVVIDGDYHTTAKSFTVPFNCTIKDVFVRSKALSGSGTATLRRSSTAITSAMTMATDAAMARTASLVDAQLACTAGETLNVITNGANDRGVVTLLVVRA